MTDNSKTVKEKITELTKKYENYVIDCRRKLHRMAEVSGKEYKTSAFIRSEAESLGLTVEKASETGLLVTLSTKRPGNGVALRADIDALPIEENECNLKVKRNVVSDNPGVCHACGHDGHVSMLLGAMRVLNDIKDLLSGNVYFCFEEGEEISNGYQGMIAALSKKKVNTVFSLHLLSFLEHGKLSLEEGVRTSGIIGINAVFSGKGGHSSRPDLAANPVFCAANAVTSLPVVLANRINAEETLTVAITDIKGSGAYNIIPDKATVLGSVRFFDEKEGEKALGIIRDVFENTASYSKCTVSYNRTGILTIPAVNDKEATELAKSALMKYAPEIEYTHFSRWFASESIAVYLKKYKGVFGYLGIKNEEKGCGADHHNGCFDIDESVLINGMLAHVSYTVEALLTEKVGEWKERPFENRLL